MDNLDEFLKEVEEPIEAVAAEVETPEVVDEEPKGQGRDDKGRFAPKGETEAAPPAAEEQHSIPPKALQEERRKRQEYEAELTQLRAQLQQLQNPPAPPPSLWDDEQAFGQHIADQATQQAVQQATFNARLDMSEMMVRQSHPDFEDKKATFIQLMQETPGLQQKALADPHPWNFAYNYVSSHQRMQELSATNVTELEARLREQIKAELAAEPKTAQPIPDTLADAQSARGSTETFTVPTLEQILKR